MPVCVCDRHFCVCGFCQCMYQHNVQALLRSDLTVVWHGTDCVSTGMKMHRPCLTVVWHGTDCVSTGMKMHRPCLTVVWHGTDCVKTGMKMHRPCKHRWSISNVELKEEWCL